MGVNLSRHDFADLARDQFEENLNIWGVITTQNTK